MKTIDYQSQIGPYIWNEQNLLGFGSYGQVFKGCHVHSKQEIAIQIIQKTKRIQDDANQVQVMKRLKHRNVIELIDYFEDQQYIYLIMCYCPDGDLKKLIQSNPGGLDEMSAKRYLKEILNGFKELVNKNIIHRDLKPSNILIDQNTLQISDFGMAKILMSITEEEMNGYVGTRGYMSPEVMKGQQYNAKTDIWSLGIIYYELLYGQVPFQLVQTQQEQKSKSKICYENLNLVFPINKLVSQVSQDFISACLKVDVNKRLGWDTLYNHELLNFAFMKEIQQPLIYIDKEASKIIKNMQKCIFLLQISLDDQFEKVQKIEKVSDSQTQNLDQQLLLKFLSSLNPKFTNMDAEYLFRFVDIESQGVVTLNQLQLIFFGLDFYVLQNKIQDIFSNLHMNYQSNPNVINNLFNFVDTEKRGAINFKQFMNMTKVLYPCLNVYEAFFFFNQFDVNHDGIFSIFEFKKFIKDYCFSNLETTKLFIQKLRQQITINSIDLLVLFNNLDVNSDGFLDLVEFQQVFSFVWEEVYDQPTQLLVFNEFQNPLNGSIDFQSFKSKLNNQSNTSNSLQLSSSVE